MSASSDRIRRGLPVAQHRRERQHPRRYRVRTTAIVAAYNEEGTIADVLRALTASPLIDEVIVVSDGSEDATVEIGRASCRERVSDTV